MLAVLGLKVSCRDQQRNRGNQRQIRKSRKSLAGLSPVRSGTALWVVSCSSSRLRSLIVLQFPQAY